MDDRGLDEYKGDVDFDFFDEEGDSVSENPPKDLVLGKPPAARKSPHPSTPTKLTDLGLDLTDLSKKKNDNSSESESDSDGSYSSDSVTETDSESDHGKSSKKDNNKHRKPVFDDKNRQKSKSTPSSDSESSEGSHTDSESESDTQSLSKVSPVSLSKKNKKASSQTSSSDSYNSSSSDSESDVEDESNSVPSGSNRPKTGHSRRSRTKHKDAWSNGVTKSPESIKDKRPNDKDSRKGRLSNKKAKDDRRQRASDSESEITDVSPLNSAQNSPRRKKKNIKRESDCQSNGHDHSEGDTLNESERLDLNILVDAVSELDKNSRIKANTRRVMFAPPKPGDKHRENYTYSNERAKIIERENQRLLNEILSQVEVRQRSGNQMKYEPHIRRLTASAINRERQQRKIEMENLALLGRIKKAKPTRGMSKVEQDEEYHRTMLYGVPVSVLHASRPKSRASTPWDSMSFTANMGARTRSLNSVHSAASTTTMGSVQSTYRRPTSAKKKPEWNDRW